MPRPRGDDDYVHSDDSDDEVLAVRLDGGEERQTHGAAQRLGQTPQQVEDEVFERRTVLARLWAVALSLVVRRQRQGQRPPARHDGGHAQRAWNHRYMTCIAMRQKNYNNNTKTCKLVISSELDFLVTCQSILCKMMTMIMMMRF